MTRVSLGLDSSGRPLVVDRTTLEKLRYAEANLGKKLPIVQGSYMAGVGAAASADTHDKGGVIDIRSRHLSDPEAAVLWLRRAGFVAWYRTKAQGFDPHIHAIDLGNPNLAPSASRQVTAWRNGYNGLKSNGADDGPRVDVPVNVPHSRQAGPKTRAGIEDAFEGRLAWDAFKAANPGLKKTIEGLFIYGVHPDEEPIKIEQFVAVLADVRAELKVTPPGATKTIRGLERFERYLVSMVGKRDRGE